MNADLVLAERRGPIAVLTLNRPDKLNAISRPMLLQLAGALQGAQDDSTVRAIVLAGNGRAFSSGFDMNMELAEDATSRGEAVRRALREDFEIIMRFWDCPKVTLAAVHGYCLGSAMELALARDLTVAAE